MILISYLTVDLVFMGICFYITGLCTHLKLCLHLATLKESEGDKKATIMNCVRMHNDILGFVLNCCSQLLRTQLQSVNKITQIILYSADLSQISIVCSMVSFSCSFSIACRHCVRAFWQLFMFVYPDESEMYSNVISYLGQYVRFRNGYDEFVHVVIRSGDVLRSRWDGVESRKMFL